MTHCDRTALRGVSVRFDGLTRAVLVLAVAGCASHKSQTQGAAHTSVAACPRGVLPAYAHNDYNNVRPLVDALALGFRGAEVDVFLVDGVLRVGHDRSQARRSGTFEDLYLRQLAAVVGRCGPLTADGRPFLLTVEIKEHSQATYDSVVHMLMRYHHLLSGGGLRAPVEVVLVGWHPLSAAERGVDSLVGRQYRLTDINAVRPLSEWGRVRLISVDYGKTLGRPWVTGGRRRRWLATIARLKSDARGRLIRVHNVPSDRRVYADLLGAGVDLIGVEKLVTARQILVGLLPSTVRP